MLEARARAIGEGDPAIGWKAAVTHPPTQAQLGLSGPLIGYLLESSERRERRVTPPARGVALVELELALQLGDDLPEAPTLDQARAAISHAAPALEILAIDEPLDDLLRIAERNAFHAFVQFGAWRRADASALDAPLRPSMFHDGAPVERFDPELVIGSPGEILRFMAETLAPFGERLRAGDRIICGSLNKPLALSPGASILGRLEGVGETTLTFEN